MNKRRFWLLGSVLPIVALLLNACGTAATPVVITQPPQVITAPPQVITQVVQQTQIVAGTPVVQNVVVTTTPVPAYSGPKTRVNLWHTIPTDTETYFIGELMPKFNAMHPECNIVTRNMGVENASIIDAGLAANDANSPNLWWVASSETGKYVQADVLADVDTWLNQNPDIKKNIIPSLLDLSSWQGKVRSLPWMTNNTAMWINTDAFNKAGIAVPSQDPTKTWTWDEFAADVKKLTTADMKGFLVTVNTGWDMWTYTAWYGAAGGDTTGTTVLTAFDSPAALKAVQFQKDLLDGGYAATTPTGWDAAPWYAGKVAIMADGPWNFPKLSTFKDFQFTVVPYPRDAKPATNLGGDQLFLGKTSDPKVQACEFAFGAWVLSDDFQIAFQEQSGNLPVTISASSNKDYQAYLAKYPFMAGFVNGTPYGVTRPPVPKYGDVQTAFSQAWDNVMLKHADVKTTFTKLASDAAGILK